MSTGLAERRLHGIAVYNPDLLSKQELIAQFAARGVLFEQLLSDLRRPDFAQHQIIVGTRGMGKTTLLRRLRYAVEDAPDLSGVWLPLTFPEEQYNVARLSDLYLNILDALGDALEQRGKHEEAAALDEAAGALPRGSEESWRAEAALALLLGTAERLGRRLVLLVDNLDLVLGRLEPNETWAFRELLSREHRILLVGAMPVIIGATYEYGAPFYDFFQIHELHGLTREETRELLSRLAQDQDARAVEHLLATDPARVDTLHTLTGGNPRTIVLLFNVLAQGTEGDVRSDLEKLLDQSTPLYKARFEALPPQAQQVVDDVSIHWAPVTAGEVSARINLDVNTVSAQLNRLVQQGVLEKVELDPPTKTGFQVAERFFNIWYLMRASRRVRRRLIWLVEFLRLFFGAEQLKARASTLLAVAHADSGTSKLRHAEFCLALAQVLDGERQTRLALESRAIRTLLMDHELSKQINTILDLDGSDASLRDVVDREQWLEDFRHGVSELPGDEQEKKRIGSLIASSPGLTRAQRLISVRRCLTMSDEERDSLLSDCEKSRQLIFVSCGSRLGRRFLEALQEGYMDTPLDEAGARTAAVALDAPELEAPFADVERLSELLMVTEDPFVKACMAFELLPTRTADALKLATQARDQESFAWTEYAYGRACAGSGMLEKAIPAFRKAAIELPIPTLWCGLAQALSQAGRLQESLDAFRRALDIERHPDTLEAFGKILLQHARVDEAELVLREALSIAPEKIATINWLAYALVTQGKPSALAELSNLVKSRTDLVGDEALICSSWLFLAGEDGEALSLMRRVIPSISMIGDLVEEHVATLFMALGVGVERGHSAQLRDLFEELGLQEPMRPAYEALRIAAGANRATLKRLAPEVREPTEVLLREWEIPEAPVSPRKKKPTKRRRT